MALAYGGIAFELREILLRDKPAQILALSPKGTVPVLQLASGEVLEESLDIMHWALAQADPDLWWPAEADKQAEIRVWIHENDQAFKKALDGYKYPRQNPSKTASEWRDLGMLFLKKMNQRLTNQAYLLGEKISLADVALFPFVRQFAGVDRDYFDQAKDLKNTRTWLEVFLNSQLFLAVMKKYSPWKLGDESIYFCHVSKG